MAKLMTIIPLDAPLRQKNGNWRALRSASGEDAQGLVELALAVPLFLILLLGSAEFARFAWASILASNAARAGASYGSQSSEKAGDIANVKLAAANDSVNLTGLTTADPIVACYCNTPQSAQITCSTALIPPASASNCLAPNTIIKTVQVNTSVTVTPLAQYPGLPTRFTATGQSIMVIEQ